MNKELFILHERLGKHTFDSMLWPKRAPIKFVICKCGCVAVEGRSTTGPLSIKNRKDLDRSWVYYKHHSSVPKDVYQKIIRCKRMYKKLYTTTT